MDLHTRGFERKAGARPSPRAQKRYKKHILLPATARPDCPAVPQGAGRGGAIIIFAPRSSLARVRAVFVYLAAAAVLCFAHLVLLCTAMPQKPDVALPITWYYYNSMFYRETRSFDGPTEPPRQLSMAGPTNHTAPPQLL